ncbi:MAG: hypothetical protein JO024_09365 [Candidatus Eremiobacteraeota bacterium]|nr:hypothetical protein [Candidatus Eremiobacteraeota bacterium]
MFQRILFAFIAAGATVSLLGATPKLSGKPVGAEVQFVRSIQADLMHRFPTAADAEKSGYVRFTYEDSTGSISYANRQWQSADPQHPSQLWYDVKGNLLGADFSVLQANSPKPPHLWGVNPARWVTFRAHVHYIATDPQTKQPVYSAIRMSRFTAAGGDPANPTAETLVKTGAVKDASSVQTVFTFPAIWDLIVWVKPNPNGAFAEKNPNVIPSKNAEKDGM